MCMLHPEMDMHQKNTNSIRAKSSPSKWWSWIQSHIIDLAFWVTSLNGMPGWEGERGKLDIHHIAQKYQLVY